MYANSRLHTSGIKAKAGTRLIDQCWPWLDPCPSPNCLARSGLSTSLPVAFNGLFTLDPNSNFNADYTISHMMQFGPMRIECALRANHIRMCSEVN